MPVCHLNGPGLLAAVASMLRAMALGVCNQVVLAAEQNSQQCSGSACVMLTHGRPAAADMGAPEQAPLHFISYFETEFAVVPTELLKGTGINLWGNWHC